MPVKKKHILLIEDNEGDAFLIEEMLNSITGFYFSMYVAAGVIEAVELLKKIKIELIFLDLTLPDADRLEGVLEITEKYPHLPVIVLTGIDDEEIAQEALRLGVQDYLIKGQIKESILEKSIRYALERKAYQIRLEKSERNYRTLIEQMNEGILAFNKQGVINYVNPAMARMLGMPAENILNSIYSNFFFDKRIRFDRADKKKSGETGRYEVVLNPPEKEKLYCIASFEPVYDERNKYKGKFALFTDITKQKINEKIQLRENKFINTLIDTARAFVLVLDNRGRIIRSNKYSHEVTGYSATDMIRKKFWNVFSEEDRTDEIKQIILQIIKKNETAVFDSELISKNKKRKYVSWSISMFHVDEDGSQSVICIGHDITAIIQTQNKLFESQERFKLLVESMSEGFIIENNLGQIVYANNKFQKLLGYDFAELSKKPSLSFVAVKHKNKFEIMRKKKIESRQLEISWVKKNGSELTTIFSPRSMSDFMEIDEGRFAVVTNISELKNTEKYLRTALVGYTRISQELRHFIDTANAPIFSVNINGKVTEWNKMSEKLTGYRKNEVIGSHFIDYVHTESETLTKEAIKKALSGDPVANFEARLNAKEKTKEVILLLNATPRLDATGSINGLWSVGQDITELSRYRASLIQMVTERTSKIKEMLEREKRMTKELTELLDKEKELSQLKSKFVSMVSHEFRTPLAAIRLSSDLLKFYDTKMSDKEKNQKIDKIHKEINRMTRLIEDVLTLGKAEEGRIQINPAPLNLTNTVCNIIKEVSETTSKLSNENRFVFNNYCDNEFVVIDEKILFHIISNLLTNAVKYSSPDTSIHIEVRKENNELIISVKDEGIGISNEDKESILEPFFRGKNVGNRQGIGLGLSVLSVFLKEQKGSIDIKSNPGEGSMFTVRLPAVFTHNTKIIYEGVSI
ncbi:MAG: PAS domain S-box protein [Spirochaetia bacterium]|nr:PAS domain S-box protein [Spirochaetia bacterium]